MIFKVIGDEAEFLSTNNDLELKVMRSVCHEYLKDESVKPIILAAFQTLFDKGFAKFRNNLRRKIHSNLEASSGTCRNLPCLMIWIPMVS